MKKNIFVFSTLISIILFACSPQVTVTSEVTVTLASSTAIPTLIPTSTEIPLEALPVEELAQKYLAGEFDDISFLSNEQRAAFSSAWAEYKNEQDGINFVQFRSVGDKQCYLDPKTLETKDVPANADDAFKEANSFERWLPVKTDPQTGDVQYFYNGEWHTILGSAGIDLGMEITDPTDPRIKLPATTPIDGGTFVGRTVLEASLMSKVGGGTTATLITPLKNALGEIPLEVGPAFNGKDVFQVVQFITDDQGNIVGAKISLLIPASLMSLYAENSIDTISSPVLRENSAFWQALESNQLYFLFAYEDPDAVLETNSHASTDNITGINGSKDIELIVGDYLLKKAD